MNPNTQVKYEWEKPCRHSINGRWIRLRNHVHKRSVYKEFLYKQSNICQLCLKPIESIESANLDHIIPRDKGGIAMTDNLQLTHRKCNYEKSNFIIPGIIK